MKAIRNNIKRQRGFTLMEILIGALIFLFLLGTIGGLVLSARDNVTAGADTALIQNARARVQQCAQSYGADYGWVTTAQAISCGAVPQQRVRGTTALNAFNGTLTFTAGTGDASFVMSSQGVPGPEECRSEAAISYGTWVRVQVNGTTVPQNDESAAIAAVSAACIDGQNTITYESS